jgi:predicted transcriptional regulator
MIDESSLAIETTNMMDKIPIVYGSNEYEMIELFQRINVSRPIALTLTCLVKGKEISSHKIERLTGLRQPEVSLAMRYLQRNNWIEFREEKKSKDRGRPVKIYKLTIPLNQIIDKLGEKITAESGQVLINIEFLKKMSDINEMEP